MADSEEPQEPAPEPGDDDADGHRPHPVCHWCQGSGFVPRVLAHNPGPDPFRGPADTVHRTGQCRHCRGTGSYESLLDPTIGPEDRSGDVPWGGR
ncbi:hypothetical protein J7W19_18840 [Streptomyces mobaraensis NBRC 13819 = DSM 40847]|uniref:Uncharacterized protein n=1 Tax=Streptomyces mobaraensis (strain ATCC 29032 / DSM 40847 / JCM 4168 / NBRC 13819 / NCIMB 11159 / IPCR 16-22) TaxID=1223523 RepID=M3BKV5_STRM1|nr:hypothetical protein [Streptomyces mobaraensis]EMF00235.1 hypothetical protein H340_12630 [Streptomyces mobaraensis NBRC 13819 = DSM 40847]QTT75154.1 hypothetical protein J7W19_18840 [Streptomyces mobaraensis NBRC 13819 = DSM 40847]